MRDRLVGVVNHRPAHFASNLGVVELCLALHLTFDFSKDRLIWDTGHQIYPHKLITGRADALRHDPDQGRPDGLPEPGRERLRPVHDRPRRLRPSTALGLKAGDNLVGQAERHSVAVIGDGAFPSGIVFEALNNAAGPMGRKFLVVLNDNQMSICPRVGGVGYYLDKARMMPAYDRWNKRVKGMLPSIPLVGEHAETWLQQFKDAIKASLHGGMLFEDLGFAYLGPIDGHDITTLRKYLKKVKAMDGPVLLHVLTDKGRGFEPAMKDPVKFHAPAPFESGENGIIPLTKSSGKAYTDAVSAALFDAMGRDPKVAVLTAAMCEGNKLQKIRETFPDRFFDVGICESHAVAFAAGMAKAGARPVVDIYSTFLQRGFDQIFQEVSLQNLPVVFTLDRGGLVGADGPTHHGSFDIAYMRRLPAHGRHGPRRREGRRPDDRLRPAPRRPDVDPLPEGEPRDDRARGPADRAGPGGDPRVGDRRHAARLRHVGGGLPPRRRAAPPAIRPADRRRQRPLRQAARPADRAQGDRGMRLRPHRRGRLPHGRLRLGGVGSGQRGRV